MGGAHRPDDGKPKRINIMKCCICDKEIPVVGGWAGGNNAEPVVKDGRCCNECNALVVLPARLSGRLRKDA
jgi:hypothetical protein